MQRQRTNRIKDLHRLEARYTQAKRSQMDRRAARWAILSLLIGAFVVWLIRWWVG